MPGPAPAPSHGEIIRPLGRAAQPLRGALFHRALFSEYHDGRVWRWRAPEDDVVMPRPRVDD